MDFRLCSVAASGGSPSSASIASASRMASIRERNQLSQPVIAASSSTDMPERMA